MNANKRRTKKQTPGEQARLRAGFDLKQASRKLRLCPRYLRQIELHGNAPLRTARRLAALYNCSGNIFLHTPKFLSELNQTFQPLPATSDGETRFQSRFGCCNIERVQRSPPAFLNRVFSPRWCSISRGRSCLK